MDRLKKGEVKCVLPSLISCYITNIGPVLEHPCTPPANILSSTSNPPQHGHKLQRRRHPRRRLPNHHRRIHSQPRNRQTNTSPRHNLVLSFRFRRRHPSRRRYRPLSTRHVRYPEWKETNHANGHCNVSGIVL